MATIYLDQTNVGSGGLAAALGNLAGVEGANYVQKQQLSNLSQAIKGMDPSTAINYAQSHYGQLGVNFVKNQFAGQDQNIQQTESGQQIQLNKQALTKNNQDIQQGQLQLQQNTFLTQHQAETYTAQQALLAAQATSARASAAGDYASANLANVEADTQHQALLAREAVLNSLVNPSSPPPAQPTTATLGNPTAGANPSQTVVPSSDGSGPAAIGVPPQGSSATKNPDGTLTIGSPTSTSIGPGGKPFSRPNTVAPISLDPTTLTQGMTNYAVGSALGTNPSLTLPLPFAATSGTPGHMTQADKLALGLADPRDMAQIVSSAGKPIKLMTYPTVMPGVVEQAFLYKDGSIQPVSTIDQRKPPTPQAISYANGISIVKATTQALTQMESSGALQGRALRELNRTLAAANIQPLNPNTANFDAVRQHFIMGINMILIGSRPTNALRQQVQSLLPQLSTAQPLALIKLGATDDLLKIMTQSEVQNDMASGYRIPATTAQYYQDNDLSSLSVGYAKPTNPDGSPMGGDGGADAGNGATGGGAGTGTGGGGGDSSGNENPPPSPAQNPSNDIISIGGKDYSTSAINALAQQKGLKPQDIINALGGTPQ